MGILLSLILTLLGVSEKEQQARISWWLGGHVNDTNYSGLWKRGTPWSHWSVWELPTMLIFHNEENVMRMWSRRVRKHARTSEELGEKKISRGNRTKQDQRETKTSFHVGTTWGKQEETGVQGLGKECASYLIHEEKFSGRKGRTRVKEENEE